MYVVLISFKLNYICTDDIQLYFCQKCKTYFRIFNIWTRNSQKVHRLGLRPFGDERLMRQGIHTSPNKPTHAPLLCILGLARVSLRSHSLATFSHIALASEPAYILVAGSLYWLGQRRRWPSVMCNCVPNCPRVRAVLARTNSVNSSIISKRK